jgi:hypothetical protein
LRFLVNQGFPYIAVDSQGKVHNALAAATRG